MTKIAAYLYKPIGKTYDFDEMVQYTEISAQEVEVVIDEFYADGWENIPNGIEELLADISNYNGVLLYSLDGLTEEQIKAMGGTSLYCINTPWIKGRGSADKLCQVVKSGEYYKKMRSLNIRNGIKASNKPSGNIPYGYVRSVEGTLIPEPSEKPILDNILSWKKSGMSVSEIAKRTKLDTWKIYGILNYWRNKE